MVFLLWNRILAKAGTILEEEWSSMNYEEARAYLDDAARYGSVLGLDTMKELLARLGNPQDDLKFIHIGGTNGKGSVLSYLSTVLKEAGYRVGRYISPTLFSYRERIQVNEIYIKKDALARLTTQIQSCADEMVRDGAPHPTAFEIETALCFLYFREEKCDLVVLETGLGGRCDATNVVPHKLVAAITKIGYDHMEVLGDTLDKIAAEKAGIIKEGTVVVNYPDQPAEAMGPILTAAAEAHTSIITPDKDDLTLLRGKRLENRIDYGGYRAALGLPGTHQANHAAMAVEIALALWREFGYNISDDAILQGLADARMPARIEVLRRHPLLLLDGCHNPDGAKMLAATLTRADFEENLVGVLGVLADKDYKDMLSDLAPCFAKVYTVTPNCPRALSAEELQKEARFHTDAEAADSVADAIRKAVDYADENNLAGVVVCGSLYLAAEARPLLLKEAEK